MLVFWDVASCGVTQTHRRNLLPLSPVGSPETLVATAQRHITDDHILIMNLHLTVGSSEMWVVTAQRHFADDHILIMNIHLTFGSSETWVATAQRHIAEHSNLITNPVSTQLLRCKLLCPYSEFSRKRCYTELTRTHFGPTRRGKLPILLPKYILAKFSLYSIKCPTLYQKLFYMKAAECN